MLSRFQRTFLALLAAILAVMWFTATQAAEPPTAVVLPENPAGRGLSELLEVLNSGDTTLWREFLEDNYSRDPGDSAESVRRRYEAFESIFAESAGLDVVEIQSLSDHSIVTTAKARNGDGPFEYLELTYEVTPAEPHTWALLSARPSMGPVGDLPEGPLTDDKIAAYMDSFIDELVVGDRFSGAVLIAREGEPFYTRVAGEASKSYGVPNRLDTKFNLGSMNKMFTGVAIAQLAQAGKLAFTDPIIKHLPEYPNREAAEKIMIHHLLTHTSGMSSYWEELFDTSYWELRTVEQPAGMIVNKPLLFEPGERFEYSNSGPLVLGLIIEAVSGQDYYTYVREHIYEPAGMINSGCFPVDEPTPNLAVGYTHMGYDGSMEKDRWRTNYYMHAVKGGPAGGGYSTVEDLLAFATALKNHVLLNEAYTDTVITGKVETGPGDKYAYLFGDKRENGHRIVGHGGGAPGINAMLDIYWDDGYTVAVMANYDRAASTVAERIQRLLAR